MHVKPFALLKLQREHDIIIIVVVVIIFDVF